MNVAVISSTGTEAALARPPAAVQPYTIRDGLTTLFYHGRLMLVAFLIPVLLGLLAGMLSKPAYVAQARLLVLYGSEYFYHPDTSQNAPSVSLDRSEIMQGELQVLQSDALAMETLAAVGVDKVYPGTPTDDRAALERAALRMERDLTVTNIPQSNVLGLSFRSRDPDIAAEVLRTLIATYLQRRTQIFQRSATPSAQADQTAFLARLHAAEAALASFADSHGIANAEQQMILLLQQQSANSQARDAAAQALSETTARLAVLEQQLRQIPERLQTYAESDRSQSARTLTENLLALEAKRRDLAARYQDSFPLVRDLDSQIAAARAQLAGTPDREAAVTRSGVNTVYQDVQSQAIAMRAQLSGLQARQAQLVAAGAAIEAQVLALSRAARQYQDLQRNRDLLDEAYRALARSNEEAQIADAAERSRTANIRVVQPPERPAVGTSLRPVLALGGVALGLIAAVAALAVARALRQVFVTVRHVSVALDLPVLATVARLPGGAAPPGRRRGGKAAAAMELPARRVAGA